MLRTRHRKVTSRGGSARKRNVGTSGCCTRAAPPRNHTHGRCSIHPEEIPPRLTTPRSGSGWRLHWFGDHCASRRKGSAFPRQQIQRKVPRRNAPATPRGRRWVQCKMFGPLVKASLCSCRKAEAKNRKFSATRGISTDRARAIGTPSCDPAWPTHRSGHRSALQIAPESARVQASWFGTMWQKRSGPPAPRDQCRRLFPQRAGKRLAGGWFGDRNPTSFGSGNKMAINPVVQVHHPATTRPPSTGIVVPLT